MSDLIDTKQHWLVQEREFCADHVRKYESVLSQGNGYMGIRASVEEELPRNCRYTLVAGTFDRREDKNTTEQPNSADVMALSLTADGQPLAVTDQTAAYYRRTLDLQTGVLTRSFLWAPRGNTKLSFYTERFVSLQDRHVAGQRLVLEAVEGAAELTITSGIRTDGRHGEPHFVDAHCRERKGILQFRERTHESGIEFVTSAAIRLWHRRSDGSRQQLDMTVTEKEDGILGTWTVQLQADEAIVLEKLCRIATSRDRDLGETAGQALLEGELERTGILAETGYRAAWEGTCNAWQALWQQRDVQISTREETSQIPDQLALRFAVYHLTCMAPIHDNRMNIGAKGLSGRGYLGHTFWDTEVYMLPYFIWEDPAGARSLLEYRYHCLGAARENARYYGQKGARYPWEAAWITDRETCPEDHFSRHEVHVTADVAYGVYAYYTITGDEDFMRRCGCQILFETANFWRSRLEYMPERDRFEIRDVIGPDEFTHEANNNAFTNYLAHLNLCLAVQWAQKLEEAYPEDHRRLAHLLDVTAWQEGADKLYLPKPGADDILPQDDDYMTLPQIDLTIYRAGIKKLRKDYPYPTYTRLKVSKQADVMNLFLLREAEFSQQVKRNSLAYYEPFCVHESSLSLCAYSMLAADCGEQEKALALFQKAKAIDLGDDMRSSDEGIHAASLGGIWQCCTLGFAGVRLVGEQLRIAPNLPKHWQEVKFRFFWQGQHLQLEATHSCVTLTVLSGSRDIAVLTHQGLLRGSNTLTWSY